MLVKSKLPAFIDGVLLNVQASGFTVPFEYKPKEGRKLPGHLKPVEEEVKPVEEEVKGKTKKQITAELDNMGINYNPRDSKELLENLLDAGVAKAVPGSIKPLDKSII